MAGPYGNPIAKPVTLENGVTYCVQAFANAARSQCVQIVPPSGATAQFDGSGENNVPMGLTQAGFLTGGANGSWSSFTVPGAVGSGSCTYQVSCSNSGGNPGAVEVNTAGFGLSSNWQFAVTFVSYEDNGGSPDFNDSFVIITSWTPPTQSRSATNPPTSSRPTP